MVFTMRMAFAMTWNKMTMKISKTSTLPGSKLKLLHLLITYDAIYIKCTMNSYKEEASKWKYIF
jgi:hypothetical protein